MQPPALLHPASGGFEPTAASPSPSHRSTLDEPTDHNFRTSKASGITFLVEIRSYYRLAARVRFANYAGNRFRSHLRQHEAVQRIHARPQYRHNRGEGTRFYLILSRNLLPGWISYFHPADDLRKHLRWEPGMYFAAAWRNSGCPLPRGTEYPPTPKA